MYVRVIELLGDSKRVFSCVCCVGAIVNVSVCVFVVLGAIVSVYFRVFGVLGDSKRVCLCVCCVGVCLMCWGDSKRIFLCVWCVWR